MFTYSVAIILCFGILLVPIVIFYILRPFIRRYVIKKMLVKNKVSLPIVIGLFIFLEFLAFGLSVIGLFSIFYPNLVDLGLIKKEKIEIISEPIGDIYINGKLKGRTPIFLYLRKGNYFLKIDGVKGYQPFDTTIFISSSKFYKFNLKRTYIGKIKIQRSYAPIREGPGENFPILATVGGIELDLLSRKDDWFKVQLYNGKEGWVHKDYTSIPENLITIHVTSSPSGAYVYIDNTYKGQTPLQLSLKRGNYYIKVGGIDGYEDSERSILISNSGDKNFYFHLREKLKPTITIRINSEPSGALVFINNIYYGKTPLTVELKPGRHLVDMTLSGYHPIRGRVISVSKDNDNCFNFTLESERIIVSPPLRGR